MGKATNFFVGAAIGAAAGWLVNYLYGPAPGTSYDAGYQSRLDWALEQGRQAAAAREAELRRQFQEKKRRPGQ